MTTKKKIYLLIIPIVSTVVIIATLFILLEYHVTKRIKNGEYIVNNVKSVFANYDNNDNIADITSLYVRYNDYYTTFNDHIYDNNQIIVTPDEVFYLYDEGFFATNFKIYLRNIFDDNEELLYTTIKMRNRSIRIKAFDNCFYIKYDTNVEKNIVDVYDIDERKYYNYSRGERVSLDDIVYEEQRKKYKTDITIGDDEKTIIIKNLETNETHIIDDELIMNSIYKDDMSMFEYKVKRAYISYGHILLAYLVGMDGRFTSTVIYEYSFDSNSIQFVFFDEGCFSDERYEYVK